MRPRPAPRIDEAIARLRELAGEADPHRLTVDTCPMRGGMGYVPTVKILWKRRRSSGAVVCGELLRVPDDGNAVGIVDQLLHELTRLRKAHAAGRSAAGP